MSVFPSWLLTEHTVFHHWWLGNNKSSNEKHLSRITHKTDSWLIGVSRASSPSQQRVCSPAEIRPEQHLPGFRWGTTPAVYVQDKHTCCSPRVSLTSQHLLQTLLFFIYPEMARQTWTLTHAWTLCSTTFSFDPRTGHGRSTLIFYWSESTKSSSR